MIALGYTGLMEVSGFLKAIYPSESEADIIVSPKT
jgi:hypothetical protein